MMGFRSSFGGLVLSAGLAVGGLAISASAASAQFWDWGGKQTSWDWGGAESEKKIDGAGKQSVAIDKSAKNVNDKSRRKRCGSKRSMNSCRIR